MFATTLSVVATKSSLERATRIELAFSAWEVGRDKRKVQLKFLISSKKQGVIYPDFCNWAYCGHTDVGCPPSE